MARRGLALELPMQLWLALEADASARGQRPSARAIEVLRDHLFAPEPRLRRRGHLRLLPLTNETPASPAKRPAGAGGMDGRTRDES
jgi:hypothetical protein